MGIYKFSFFFFVCAIQPNIPYVPVRKLERRNLCSVGFWTLSMSYHLAAAAAAAVVVVAIAAAVVAASVGGGTR